MQQRQPLSPGARETFADGGRREVANPNSESAAAADRAIEGNGDDSDCDVVGKKMTPNAAGPVTTTEKVRVAIKSVKHILILFGHFAPHWQLLKST